MAPPKAAISLGEPRQIPIELEAVIATEAKQSRATRAILGVFAAEIDIGSFTRDPGLLPAAQARGRNDARFSRRGVIGMRASRRR